MSFIIPYFIQHQGCAHRCLFCDQTAITGMTGGSTVAVESDLRNTIDLWLTRNRRNQDAQVAFYGGSFTCLPVSFQKRLLGTIHPYIQAGSVGSVRLSTRPDCLSEAICEMLADNGVKTVELGVQSMTDTVLDTARRGHNSDDSREAARLLLSCGFELGIQLMPGLPGETTVSFFQGVREVIALEPGFVRIYPAVVIKNTGLARLFLEGEWAPLSMNRAVTLARKARELFTDNGIRVVRMGLQPSQELEKQVLEGPYHPAFGELVIGRDWYLKMRRLLVSAGEGEDVYVTISDKDYSALVGPRRHNINRLNKIRYGSRLVVEVDKSMERFQFKHTVVHY